jgi:hypothetical protein
VCEGGYSIFKQGTFCSLSNYYFSRVKQKGTMSSKFKNKLHYENLQCTALVRKVSNLIFIVTKVVVERVILSE